MRDRRSTKHWLRLTKYNRRVWLFEASEVPKVRSLAELVARRGNKSMCGQVAGEWAVRRERSRGGGPRGTYLRSCT